MSERVPRCRCGRLAEGAGSVVAVREGLQNAIAEAIRAENVGCDPTHPHLLDISWIRHQEPELYSGLDPRPIYDDRTAPVGKAILDRQMCIEVGPGLNKDDIRYTASAVRRVISRFENTIPVLAH